MTPVLSSPRPAPSSEQTTPFRLSAEYRAAGDQPRAISELTQGVREGLRDQVLLGVTGSGKTFTMASIIEAVQRPALILAHNKTLAAQLYGEFKAFFPDNHVEYFVSYYDYYQPEAYVARTDTYIEKDSSINEAIDRMRHSATRSILEHNDVIIVASVSCIYGIGAVETYSAMILDLQEGQPCDVEYVLKQLVALQYTRNDVGFCRGTFRLKGDTLDVWPAHQGERAWKISFFGDEIESISEFDPLTGQRTNQLKTIRLYGNSHHAIPRPTLNQAITHIRAETKARVAEFQDMGKLVEAQRLRERVHFDIEMMAATGACSGIENYSRYLTGRKPGEPPPTLFEYLPDNAMIFVDESHQSIPQLGGMYRGDYNRKHNLSEYGFRLPSCKDNRPLKFEEWDQMRPQTIHVSATPGPWELQRTDGVFVEQLIRPTGLIDPPVEVRPVSGPQCHQVDDVIAECRETAAAGYRTLITTLTKKSAEALTEYMLEQGLKVRYMHSDIDTVERIEIIRDLRLGVFDILVGINLLREGLDIPECAFVAILDADKEGFLRSETSLVQTIGRAARNAQARVILYADQITGSMQRAMAETQRRRNRQLAHNTEHNITPRSVDRQVGDLLEHITSMPYNSEPKGSRTGRYQRRGVAEENVAGHNLSAVLAELEARMKTAAMDLEFEEAARLRDEIKRLSE